MNLIILFFVIIVHIVNSDLITTTKYGLIRGKLMELENGRNIAAYTAIPYAKPPIGKLRFHEPVIPEPWFGIRNATSVHPICVQVNSFLPNALPRGQEDCLYLNVYTPKISANFESHPVMIFIHGGAFQSGSGNTEAVNPSYLLKHNIVLVSINYRLGPLGFLAYDNKHISANNGLKDQQLAIKWVHDNIIAFGGDPKKVTVFGQSAGAGSVHFQVLSHLNKGLFQAAIIQSGSALCPWAYHSMQEASKLTEQLATFVNCSSNKIIKCLRNQDAYDIVMAAKKCLKWDIDPTVVFRPIIENNEKGAFIFDTPENIIKENKGNKVLLMFGNTHDEGVFRTARIDRLNQWNELDENTMNILSSMIEFPHIDKQLAFYFNGSRISQMKQQFIEYLSDAFFVYGIDKAIRLHKTYTNATIYKYLFSYRGTTSYSSFFGTENAGVCHCDDLQYLFPNPIYIFPNAGQTASDRNMIDVFTRMWTNFAIFNNPTPYNDNLLETKWNSITSNNHEYLSINSPDDMKMMQNLWVDRMMFWKNLLG